LGALRWSPSKRRGPRPVREEGRHSWSRVREGSTGVRGEGAFKWGGGMAQGQGGNRGGAGEREGVLKLFFEGVSFHD